MLTRGILPKLNYNPAPSFKHRIKDYEKDSEGRPTAAGTATFN